MNKCLLFFCCMLPAVLAWSQEEEPPYYIHSIYFGGGSYYIDPSQQQDFNDWLDGIPDLEHHLISIHGHTDDIGSYEYNQWLSRMRCEATLRELLKRGLEREAVSIEDFGELNPVHDNSTWEGRLKNRRVDVIIRPLNV